MAANNTQGWTQVRKVLLWGACLLFLLIGIVATGLMALLVVEGGLVSILDIGQRIDRIMSGAAPPVSTSAYTGNILTVIVITLTVAGLFITVISLAGSVGLKTSLAQIVRDLREDLSESVHDRLREMTTISHEGVRAQMATDRSVIEWQTHHAGLWEPTERKRAVLRAYKNIEFAAKEIDLALKRLDQSGAPESAKASTRVGLERLRRTILNNRAFYLAELYSLGMLAAGSELVTYDVVPRDEHAVRIARDSADEALRHVRKDDESAEFERLRYRETRLFVLDRMDDSVTAEGMRAEVEALLGEAEALTRTGEQDLTAWVADRRRDYAHLFAGDPA